MQLNSGQFGEQFRGNDLNVEPAWIQGYSGCNVTVAVVDDGKLLIKLKPLILTSYNVFSCILPLIGLDIFHDDLRDNVVSDTN